MSRRASSVSGTPSGAVPSIPVSSERACSRDLPDWCTCHGRESGSGSASRAARAMDSDSPPDGPTANWRRSRRPRTTSTTTQEANSLASRRAQRCRVSDSLNVLFSRRSRVTAVSRSIRRAMVCTAWTAAGSCPRRPGVPARRGAGQGPGPAWRREEARASAPAERPSGSGAPDGGSRPRGGRGRVPAPGAAASGATACGAAAPSKLAATSSTPVSSGRLIGSTVRRTSTTPSWLSRAHSVCRARPVRAAAAR